MPVHPLTPRLCLGAALALAASNAFAGPVPTGASAPQPEAADGATIVLIGEVGGSKPLAALLVELLERQGVRVRFLGEPRFEPAHLLSGDASDRAVWVFVELTAPRAARLSFRGPQARRFLLRDLELRDGLDDFGLELIGQVVESSVAALLHSSAGMSREQAMQTLADQSAPVDHMAVRGDHAPVASSVSSREARFGAWVGLRYAAEWSGSSLGVAQGPGGEVGAEWRGPVLLRATFSAERWFSQSLASPEVDASIQGWPLRLSADVGLPVGRWQSWLFALGGGFDVIRVEPQLGSQSSVALAPANTRLVPMLRAEVRYELGVGPWRLVLAGFTDVSLVDTHYDLDLGNSAEPLAVPSRLRPGVALIVAWRSAL